jgi:Tol biopolymer transport system component
MTLKNLSQTLFVFTFAMALYAQNPLDKVWSIKGDPFDNLPANMERLTTFGWRPSLSHDGRSVVFVNKEFGDVFTMDLVTRQLYCLTDNICPDFPEHDAFIRAYHLPNDDYLLVGINEWPEPDPDNSMGIYSRARHEECRMYYLSKEPDSLPIPFGPKFYEGVAIGQKEMKVGYVLNWWSTPSLPEGRSQLYMADLDISGLEPKLVNPSLLMETDFPPDGRLAAVDFYENDSKMSVISYDYAPQSAATALSIDVNTKKVTDMSKAPATMDEPAAMYPDNEYMLIRSTRHTHLEGVMPEEVSLSEVDLYKLKLDGTGKNCQRLTHISDYYSYKAHNAAIAKDGTFMVFQVSAGGDHGLMTSRGLVLYRIK